MTMTIHKRHHYYTLYFIKFSSWFIVICI